jgi:hypothetical protein
MSGAEHVARIGNGRISCRVSIKITEGKRLLANPRHIWEDNVIITLKN